MDWNNYEERRIVLAPFHYLPLFYLLPDELAIARKLDDFPRNPYEVVTDERWRNFYYGKFFQSRLMDAWGWLMWQGLGIKGGVESYSINDPFVLMVFNLPMWAALLAEMGITTELLASYPPEKEIPFLTMDEAVYNAGHFIHRFWEHPQLRMQEVWEVIKTHRDHRDFSAVNSHVKTDFHRKWYHTRAKIKTQFLYDEEGNAVYAPYIPNGFAEVELRIWFWELLKRLDERDRTIVQRLEEGYNQEEIAQMLGYANHSGVSKRVTSIRKEFEKFRRE